MSRAGSARYLCDRCGRDLSGVAMSAACVCGSVLRRRIDGADAVYRRPGTDDAPRWDPLKDWTAKYLQLLWNAEQLRRMYAPDSGADVEETRRIVQTSLTAAYRLGDWLTAGPEPVSVIPGDVARLLATEPLSVCARFTAVPVAFSRPPHFWVEHRPPDGKPVRFDALDLLERCLRAWQHFLGERGVPLPSWRG